MTASIHQYKVKTLSGKETDLSQFKGKVLLVVNTATECGFTSQLGDLEELYQEYKLKGLEVIAFPSNDFHNQEPRDEKEIQDFCEENYNVSFPIMEKVHVKGSHRAEVYKFLTDKKLNGKVSSTPPWNFHKYLLDKKGNVVDYFYTFTKPNSKKVKKAIDNLL